MQKNQYKSQNLQFILLKFFANINIISKERGFKMRKENINRVKDKKLVVIVRGVYGEDCLKLAKALYEGGIELMEVTFDQSSEENQKKTADTIRLINESMQGKVVMGAGTVTSLEMLEEAYNAGAKFIVSPDMNPEIIKATVEKGMVSMPGAMTPTEILTAYKSGADFVKVFPVLNLGSGYIKAVRGPLNHIPLLAVGGVNEKNIGEFIKAGASGAGVGGNLVNKEWIANGEFNKITELAKEFIKNINS